MFAVTSVNAQGPLLEGPLLDLEGPLLQGPLLEGPPPSLVLYCAFDNTPSAILLIRCHTAYD